MRPLALTLLPFETDELIRVRGTGRLSLVGLPTGSDPLQQLLGPRAFARKVLLDVSEASGADTSGIAWLASTTERFARSGGVFVLVGIPPSVQQILTVLGMSGMLHSARSESEGLALVQNGTHHPDDVPQPRVRVTTPLETN
ncbi:MAG: STAS domain-containing protein [Fimbriiglobus sp.]